MKKTLQAAVPYHFEHNRPSFGLLVLDAAFDLGVRARSRGAVGRRRLLLRVDIVLIKHVLDALWALRRHQGGKRGRIGERVVQHDRVPNANVFERPVLLVDHGRVDLVEHVETLTQRAENRVLAIEKVNAVA